jgi:hypothetical protein
VFRLAIDVQAHLRRFNLMLATPAWTTRPGGPLPDRMFFAGRAELAERLQRTCAARGLVLLCDPTDGARPGELLWNQLRTSAGAVVDLGATDGTARASAYYGLALAVTAGTPTAVLAPHAAPLPVELEGCPVVLLGDDHDAARLDAVIDLAVCRPRSTAVTAGAGALAEVVAELERLAATCPSAGRPAALIESARRAANAADPAACRRAVEMGVAELAGGPGADPTLASGAGEERATGPAPRQPVSLSPWFAPTYPSPLSGPRRLLHAAGPRGISAQATGAVESACVARGFSHVPLEAPGTPARPHSLVGLWRHVGAAHAVLADLTDRDPVVALVVGLAHAWGKPVRIVIERSAADSAANRQPESFPPLPHRALSTWSDGAQLHDLVGAFLTAVVRAEQPAASGQASQASSAR